MELVLACAHYGVLPMGFESSLRVLTTLAALINWPGLCQCEHAWLNLRPLRPPVRMGSEVH